MAGKKSIVKPLKHGNSFGKKSVFITSQGTACIVPFHPCVNALRMPWHGRKRISL